jgi:putative spermidine/putrescine transport system ATP-binding protein
VETHSLEVQRLRKQYGATVAVDDVTLAVKSGRFLSLLGPSGSGKTTILMMVGGFTAPTAGNVLLDGRIITHLPPERRHFGMVFQGYALFPHLSAAENVGFALRVRGIRGARARERIQAALDLVKLGPCADRLPRQLSGGQQQRVALARALIFDPAVLLLDEPLSALDKSLRAELQSELKEVHRRVGTTFIYVTHDQAEALSMSDEIAILNNGRIAQVGAPTELYERPATRFVADFLGKSNFIEGHVLGVDDGHHLLYRAGDHVFRQACASAVRGGPILLALRPEKIAIDVQRPNDVPNAVQGTLRSCDYYGSNFELRVATDNLGDMLVVRPVPMVSAELKVTSSVWLSWMPEASTIVRPD